MEFKKEDLLFLKIYNACSDTKTQHGDKVIINIKKDFIEFFQFGVNVDLYTKIENQEHIEEEVSYILPVDKLTNLISLLRDDSILRIDGNKVSIGRKSKYEFEDYPMTITMVKDYKEFVENKQPIKEFVLKDLGKILHIKEFIGIKDNLDCILLAKNNFIVSDLEDISTIIKTNNDIDDEIYIPRFFVNLLNIFKFNEIEVKEYEEDFETFYLLKFENTYMRLSLREKYNVPNLMEDEFKEIYEQDSKIVLNKEKFFEAVKRLKTVSNKNLKSRIFFCINEDQIILENRDETHAYEKINGVVDKRFLESESFDGEIAMSLDVLMAVSKKLEGENIIFSIEPDDEAIVTTINDENKDIIFIHNNLIK